MTIAHVMDGSTMATPFQRDLLSKILVEEDDDKLTLQTALPLLPATYRDKHHMIRHVNSDVHQFLSNEFNVQRLNDIHRFLWLVGLPTSPRPLHYQILKKRNIVVTEELDLHLVWAPTRVYIKPLSRFMLSPAFWRSHICPHQHLYQTALGFLLSYVALIEREVDYHIAKNEHLIPREVTWTEWLAFVEEIVCTLSQGKAGNLESSATPTLEPHMPVNPRFYYGELRLGRLNWIYRLVLLKPRGYMSGCTTYGAFMRENVNSLITLFAYTTVVLSAMQVGLGTTFLAEDYAFGMASYVFSVFSILAPLLAIAAIFGIVVIQFVVNLLRTLHFRRKRQRQGAGV